MRTPLIAMGWAVLVGGVTAWVLSAAGAGAPRVVLHGRTSNPVSVLAEDGRTLAEFRTTLKGDRDEPNEFDSSRLALVDLAREAPDIVLCEGRRWVHHIQFLEGDVVAAVVEELGPGTREAVTWDRKTGAEIRRRRLPSGSNELINGYAFRDGGKLTAIVPALGDWRAEDAETGEVLGAIPTDVPPPGAIGRYGSFLMSAGEPGTRIWLAATGEQVGRFPPPPGDWQVAAGLGVFLNAIQRVNGEFLILNLGEDRVQLWNATTGERREIETSAPPIHADISADGRWLLTSSLEIPPPPSWWDQIVAYFSFSEEIAHIDPMDKLVPRTRLYNLATGKTASLPRPLGEGRMAASGTIAIWDDGKLFVYDNPPPVRMTPIVVGAAVGIVVGLIVIAIRSRSTHLTGPSIDK